MTQTPSIDPRKVLDETATSIKELSLELENRQAEGRGLTVIEIQAIANQLRVHVERLLAASESLRDENPEE